MTVELCYNAFTMKRNLFISILAWSVMTGNAATAATPEEDFNKGMELVNAGNPAEAVPFLRAAAEQGNLEAQKELWKRYSTGDGVEKNDEFFIQWLRAAAEQGDAVSQYNLGTAYYMGRGLQVDNLESLKWYRSPTQCGCNVEIR